MPDATGIRIFTKACSRSRYGLTGTSESPAVCVSGPESKA